MPEQQQLELATVNHATINDLEMGILEDGTPYLSGRALAKLCDVGPGVILTWLTQYDPNAASGRDAWLRERLRDLGHDATRMSTPTSHGNVPVSAVPDVVCMAVLEYYAFESRSEKNKALDNYRRLARASLRALIYRSLGYDADGVPVSWRQFHDRIQLHTAPPGYFTVFGGLAPMLLTAMQNGLVVDSQTVPDISVGRSWSDYWKNNELGKKYGERVQADHLYPLYFPQAVSNPQTIHAYPEDAQGRFNRWLREEYLPNRFPRYLLAKVKQGLIASESATRLIEAMAPKQIPEED